MSRRIKAFSEPIIPMKEISTNEQNAKEIADEICKRHIFDSNHFDCCMEMAQWKDEQHAQEKQQWIDKACEWLSENASDYVITTMLKTSNDNYKVGTTYLQEDKLVGDFLKAMKGE